MNTEQSNKLRNTQRQESRVTRFYRSFSGTDALVFAILPQTEPVLIGSISTLSYSMYRDKKPVPVIGKVNMGGYTRGVRLYAGTMIFTLINQHWINELKDAIPWIDNVGVQKIDELPLMDLMIVCANEYGAAMQMMLYGVEVTEEGQVISIENLFTENTFSFVARDLSNFSNEFLGGKGDSIKIEPMVKYNQFGINQLSTNFTPTYTQGPYEWGHQHDFRPSYIIANDEIKKVQEKLNHPSLTETRPPLVVNGWYDSYTYDAVKDFQSQAGLDITGEFDDETHGRLNYWIESANKGTLEQIKMNTVRTAVVHRSEGAIVKSEPTFNSDTAYIYPALEQVYILSSDDKWALTHKGYVPKELLEYHENPSQAYQPIKVGENNQVELVSDIQEALKIEPTGRYDQPTHKAIQEFQSDYQLRITEELDETTWLALKEIYLGQKYDRHVAPIKADLISPTGKSKVEYAEMLTQLNQYGIAIQSETPQDIQVSTIAKYHNGEFECQTHGLKALNQQVITMEDYTDSLMYHPVHQSTPIQLEFSVCLSDDLTYKWDFEIEKGVQYVTT